MLAPDITFRNVSSPWDPITPPLTYVQTVAGVQLPVLQGTQSDIQAIRIYNNFACNPNVSNALNVHITTWDGAGAASHTASTLVPSQHWLHVYEYGYGENSVNTVDVFTAFNGTDTAVGGTQQYLIEHASDVGDLTPTIRAYSNNSGYGYVHVITYLNVPSNAPATTLLWATSVSYEYTT